MNNVFLREIAPGEIWAVGGSDATARGAWCRKAAADEAIVGETALLCFAHHAQAAQRAGGWPAARYYEDNGSTVAEFLSYNAVYDVNPYEIGARRAETRKVYKVRQARILQLLDLHRLMDRPMIALSNGEMRRVLLARALSKGPKILVLDDPSAGLDVTQRGRLKDILAALSDSGLAIAVAYRHFDELPRSVAKWIVVDAQGRAKETQRPKVADAPADRTLAKVLPHEFALSTAGKRVVEIRNLNIGYGKRQLYSNFSWTVCEGERWILHGENGSGKTTLMALITGDSPMAYAADIRVFGIARDTGSELARVRRRIGMTSPEMQAYLGKSPFELLEEALKGNPKLLLLDEPFMNMDVSQSRKATRQIEAFLQTHRKTAAIMICHRPDEVPACFNREITLPAPRT